MDIRAFLGLQQTHNPFRWFLPVDLRLCTGGNFLYGGSALGAAISALEGTTGRNVIWTTAQYLSYARPGEVMDIDVYVPVAGNAITQARVIGHVGEREIITVNAALGDRDFEHEGQFVTAPEAGSHLVSSEILYHEVLGKHWESVVVATRSTTRCG